MRACVPLCSVSTFSTRQCSLLTYLVIVETPLCPWNFSPTLNCSEPARGGDFSTVGTVSNNSRTELFIQDPSPSTIVHIVSRLALKLPCSHLSLHSPGAVSISEFGNTRALAGSHEAHTDDFDPPPLPHGLTRSQSSFTWHGIDGLGITQAIQCRSASLEPRAFEVLSNCA